MRHSENKLMKNAKAPKLQVSSESAELKNNRHDAHALVAWLFGNMPYLPLPQVETRQGKAPEASELNCNKQDAVIPIFKKYDFG
jgi:hypothetical protein